MTHEQHKGSMMMSDKEMQKMMKENMNKIMKGKDMNTEAQKMKKGMGRGR